MASIFACWPRLRAACAPLSHLDVEGDVIPMLTAFNSAYAELCATRADIEAQYLEFKKHKYLTIRGGGIEGHFRPNDLPLAKTLPTIKGCIGDAESKSSPPRTAGSRARRPASALAGMHRGGTWARQGVPPRVLQISRGDAVHRHMGTQVWCVRCGGVGAMPPVTRRRTVQDEGVG